MSRIYDPKNPNWNGYRIARYDPSFPLFISEKVRKWYHEALWRIYGRQEVVSVLLHRKNTLSGKIKNAIAKRLLDYIYLP